MEYSKNFNFALPSRDNDVDLADINEISNNFRKIDENAVKKEVGKGLSTNDFTDEYKSKVENALTSENIDQTYSSGSKNAQSGIAVEEAIKTVTDTAMSDTSENPVQNKVVKKYVDEGHTVKLVGMLNLDIAEQGLYYTDSIGYQGNVRAFSDFRFILYSKGFSNRKDVITVSGTGITRLNLLNMRMEPIYNYTIIDDVLSDISNNAIANKVVTQALLQQEIDLKNYADSLKTTVDSEMSDTSENPIQNKVVKWYIDDKIKQTTEQSTTTVMSQKATTDELKNKLPKSPTNWEQWTAEEQAAAREKIGILGDYELIDDITTDEDVVEVVRNVTHSGDAYNFNAVALIINVPGTTDKSGNVRVDLDDVENHIIALVYGLSGIGTTDKRTVVIWKKLRDGLYIYGGGIENTQNQVAPSRGYNLQDKLYEGTPYAGNTCCVIKVRVQGGTMILPAGTHIKIYGVKV